MTDPWREQKLFVQEHLLELVEELRTYRDTGLKPKGNLQYLEKLCRKVAGDNFVVYSLAERLVIDEAFEYVAAHMRSGGDAG